VSRLPVQPGPSRPLAARGSAVWALVFRGGYRVLRFLDPLIRSSIANGLPGLDGVVELRTVGRRSGRPRSALLTLMSVGDRWYVGHPNGEASWVRNAEASGWVEISPPRASGSRFVARRLPPGPERDAVIRATWSQQPFPANILYRAARGHVAAAGVYYRLDPIPAPHPRGG
jgi:hypothetical protein